MRYKVWMNRPRIYATLSDAREAADKYFAKTGFLVAVTEAK